MNVRLRKIVLPWLVPAVLLPVLALSLTAVPVGAGCCGGPPVPVHIFSLDVSPSGSGGVEIGGKLPGSYPFARLLDLDEVVYLEAIPADGYYFVGWSGSLSGDENPTAVTMVAATEIVAHFFPEEIVSEDNHLHLVFREGTLFHDRYGAPLFDIELAIAATPPPPPPSAEIIGPTYELGPHGATFDRLATLNLSYDPAEIPAGVAEEDLVLGYYDDETGQWLLLNSEVDASMDTLSTRFDHLSDFAVIAPEPPPPAAPAAFTVSALNISPLEADIGEAVAVSVLVTNTGEAEGSYSLSLALDGAVVETKEITMASGSLRVNFSVDGDEAGSYSVAVNGLEGSFTVREAPVVSEKEEGEGLSAAVSWTLIGLAIAAFLILVIVIIVRICRRDDDDYFHYYYY